MSIEKKKEPEKGAQPAGQLKIDILAAFRVGNINVELKKSECAVPPGVEPNDACQKLVIQLLMESGFQIGWKWFEPKEAPPGGVNQVKVTGPGGEP